MQHSTPSTANSPNIYTVRETPDYKFELDERVLPDGVMTFVHAEIRNCSPTVLRQCHAEWKLFRQAVPIPLFAQGPADEDEKWRKFVRAFGFKFIRAVPCNNGQWRSLYWHTV
jgi:hypothetical protein